MSAGADADARKQSAISQNEQTLLWLANQSLLTTAYFFPCRRPPSEVVPSFHLMVPPPVKSIPGDVAKLISFAPGKEAKRYKRR